MTISSSLNAGVAGLRANANQLATISDNIANASTYGYKRAVTDFHSMVAGGSANGTYSAGGVRTTSTRLIAERGSLISTTNATDLSVDGRGFLPVAGIAEVKAGAGELPLSLTTTASFRVDAEGYLKSDSGQVLLGWQAAADGTVPTFSRDTASGLTPVRINTYEVASNPTSAMTVAVNLPATGTEAGAPGTAEEISVEYFGNLGKSESLSFTFTPTVPGVGESNEWTMVIRDSASGGAVVGEYTLTFDDSAAAGGTLDSVTTVSGAAYDGATGTIAVAVAGGTIALDIGLPGERGGMSQLSDTFAPVTVTKNGSAASTIASLEVDPSGNLFAVYEKGFTRKLYQIPLVDVPNANGLTAIGNQAYRVSLDSGSFFLWDAGAGPTGAMIGFSREESTTDTAAELTQLIETQRAYSSNAKIIQTVDEMLQETTNLKR
jgi:flagellar hook protein FlgE